MADAGLQIVIGADISAATSELKKASGDVAKFGDVVEGSIEEARLTLKRMKAEIASFSQAQLKSTFGKELIADFKQAQAELKKLEREANLISSNSANKQTVRGGVELSNLAIGQGSEIQNLNSLSHTFSRLVVETGSAKGALAALSGSLFSTTGLILALPLAIAGISKLIEHFTELSDKEKQLKKDHEKLKSAEGEIFANVGKEASQVTVLVDVLNSETETRKRKNEALKELQKLAPDNFSNLKLEGDTVKGLTTAYNEYLQNLRNVVAVKVLQTRLEQLLEQQLRKQGTTATGIARLGTIEGEKEQLQRLREEYKKTGDPYTLHQIDLLTQSLKANDNALDSIGKQIEQVNDQIKGLTTGVTLHKEATKKDGDELSKQLALLEKIRDAAKDFQGKLFDLKDIDAATDKLAALEQQVGDLKLKIAIRDAKKAGLPAEEIVRLSDAIKADTQKRLSEAFQKEALLLEFSPKLKFSQVIRAQIPTDIDSEVAKATGLDKKIPVITLHEARVKILGSKITAQIEGREHIIDELNKQISGIFEGGLNDALSGIGEAFGEALASSDFGAGLKKAAENILGVVGNVMQQLGKAVIAAAIKIKLLKETLEKWAIANPGLAILAGIGLIAAGAALKNIKFDGPKFAEGGIATGPVIGQVGERFRPEVILPLDRLPQLFKQIGGDIGGGMQLIPIINNEGLYLAMKRGERSAGRKF